jgi:hypothetical protein
VRGNRAVLVRILRQPVSSRKEQDKPVYSCDLFSGAN